MNRSLYLDDSATTRVWPEVIEVMNKTMGENYGNPSSVHEAGEKATDAMNSAREKLAKGICARAWEVYFTSGGSESDNWVIQGLSRIKANREKKKIIVSEIEHAAIMDVCDYMSELGYEIVKVKVDSKGILDLDDLEKKIGDGKNVLVVSVMHVNNVLGAIQPIKEIGMLCKKKRVLFHTDACQSFGKLRIDVNKINVDLLSASGHKIGGPKGIGLLYIREGVKIRPLILGGGQEKGLRSGTENVPGIVGFAKAFEIMQKIPKENIKKLRDKLISELEKIGGKINGVIGDGRIYCNVHVSFSGIESDNMVMFLSHKGIYVSSGSACDSKKEGDDGVLRAIGLKSRGIGSIRITLGSDFKEKDVGRVVSEIDKIVKKFREIRR